MEVAIFNMLGEEVKRIEVSPLFKVPIRTDLIERVFIHQFTHHLQPKGRYPLAGRERGGAEYFGVGLGLARVPRIKQHPLRGRAAIVAMARGGRKPHVTTPEKKIYKHINRKERLLAIASAIAATGVRKLVAKRGHKIDKITSFPIIVNSEVETISKTREFREFAVNIGIYDDILRVREGVKRVGGKASWRGRRRKIRRGPLIVYGEDKGIYRAARNILGIDVVSAKEVSVLHLAPGGMPGRLTVWIETAIPILEDRLKYILDRIEVLTI